MQNHPDTCLELMNEDTFFQTDQITPADEEVKIIDFTAEPYQDKRRVKVNFRLSYFQEPPSATISLLGIEGEELTSVDVVNIIRPENEVTLHIPASQVKQGNYQVKITLLHLGEGGTEGNDEGKTNLSPHTLTSRKTTFTIQ